MLLRQRLVDGLKEAMKAKDKRRSLVIKSILSDITLSDKSTKPDEPALILQRGIKKRLESIAAFATRPDLADNERMEIEILILDPINLVSLVALKQANQFSFSWDNSFHYNQPSS